MYNVCMNKRNLIYYLHMYTHTHTYHYRPTHILTYAHTLGFPFQLSTSAWMQIIEQTSVKLYKHTNKQVFLDLAEPTGREMDTRIESLQNVYYIYAIIIFLQHRSRLVF